MRSFEWDVSVSYASEDKVAFVEPLVKELQTYGLRVWFDAFSLKIGDSLRESIDRGLANSKFGIVVLSRSFFAKNWPTRELSALFARQVMGKEIILPVWHDISQEELLTCSPLIADVFACKSSDGISAVARALVGVIRPEAFELYTGITDSQRSVARVREQFHAKNPSLDCHVTFGSQLSPDLPRAPQGPGLVASVATDGVKIDFFAKDPATYNRNPVSGKLRLTQEGWSKIQEGLQSGRAVTLSEEHLRGVSPEFYSSFGFDPATFTEAKSLTLVPRSELLNRKFRFRVRFANGAQIEEFPYVEFAIVRAGSAELEFASNASQLPFKLTLTVHVGPMPPEFGWLLSYDGHSIRKVYRAQMALKLLRRQGGTIEFFDLEQDKVFASFGEAREMSGPEQEYWSKLDRFITDLHTIAEKTKSEILWNDNFSDEDAVHTGMLHEAVTTGSVSYPEGMIEATTDAGQYGQIRSGLASASHGLTFQFPGPPHFATVFGQSVDLGNYRVYLRPTQVEASPIPDSLMEIKMRGDVTFFFSRFAQS